MDKGSESSIVKCSGCGSVFTDASGDMCVSCQLEKINGQKISDVISDIPPRYSDLKIDSKTFKEMLHIIGGKGGVYIYGGVGTGKTFMACNFLACLASINGTREKTLNFDDVIDDNLGEYAEPFKRVKNFGKILGVSELLMKIKARVNESEQLVNSLNEEVPILILDDMGTELGSEFEMLVLYRIIDYRWLNMLPTIITSNLTLKEWLLSAKEKGGGTAVRIADRLRQMTGTLKLTGNKRNK